MTQDGSPETTVPASRDRALKVAVSSALVLAVIAAFFPLQAAGFINYDDPINVTMNPHVQGGLSLANVWWALTSYETGNWHPVTWLSYMLDCTLFGLDAGAHHTVSVALHAANAVVLFFALERMTRALYKSAFVAALFALHPLHVESVAWLSERKDVLSTLFFFLALLAYARHVERPRASAYALVILPFVLGLLSKSMVLSLPCVLLLLDVWPLGRFQWGQPRAGATALGLLKEKIPLFALALIVAIVTLATQRYAGAVVSTSMIPFATRLGGAVIAYARYVGLAFWPSGLAFFYPIVLPLPAWKIAGSVVLLAAVTTAVLLVVRRHAYLAVGWLWFFGMLVPTIGLVQIGGQAMADRYTYVPLVGLFIMAAWGVPALVGAFRHGRHALAVAALAVVAACAVTTRAQAGHWIDDHTLYEHALAVTRYNWMAHRHLGFAFLTEQRPEEAITHFEAFMRYRPDDEQVAGLLSRAHTELAANLSIQGRQTEAASHLGKAAKLAPNSVNTLRMYAWLLATSPDDGVRNGRLAVDLAERGARITDWTDPRMLAALAAAYAEVGRFDEAIDASGRAIDRARASGLVPFAESITRMRLGYALHMPFRETVRR